MPTSLENMLRAQEASATTAAAPVAAEVQRAALSDTPAGPPVGPGGFAGPAVIIDPARRDAFSLVGRPIVSTTRSFADGVRVRGTWRFDSGDDFLQLMVRGSSTPGGDWGDCTDGICARFTNWHGKDHRNNRTISLVAHARNDRGKKVYTTLANKTVPASFPDDATAGILGEHFRFELADDGARLAFTVTHLLPDGDPGGSATVDYHALAAAARDMGGAAKLAVHNREGGRKSTLLELVVNEEDQMPELCASLLGEIAGAAPWSCVRCPACPGYDYHM